MGFNMDNSKPLRDLKFNTKLINLASDLKEKDKKLKLNKILVEIHHFFESYNILNPNNTIDSESFLNLWEDLYLNKRLKKSIVIKRGLNEFIYAMTLLGEKPKTVVLEIERWSKGTEYQIAETQMNSDYRNYLKFIKESELPTNELSTYLEVNGKNIAYFLDKFEEPLNIRLQKIYKSAQKIRSLIH